MTFKIEALTEQDLEPAAALIRAQWGPTFSEYFGQEVRAMRANPLNRQLIARSSDGGVVGVACVVKADIDYALWGITWVTVAASARRGGIGAALIEAALRHAQSNPVAGSKSCVMELTTTIPGYYEKHFGFRIVDSWGKGEQTSYLMTKHLRESA